MQKSFQWWQSSDRHIKSPFPPSPSLRSLMVSVDVKHHVYLLTSRILRSFSNRLKLISCVAFQNWEKWRQQSIEKDIEYCHPRWPEEREYLESELEALEDLNPKYFSDAWWVGWSSSLGHCGWGGGWELQYPGGPEPQVLQWCTVSGLELQSRKLWLTWRVSTAISRRTWTPGTSMMHCEWVEVVSRDIVVEMEGEHCNIHEDLNPEYFSDARWVGWSCNQGNCGLAWREALQYLGGPVPQVDIPIDIYWLDWSCA